MLWDLTGGGLVAMPALFYRRSYEGEPEYISPRCHDCYERVEKERTR